MGAEYRCRRCHAWVFVSTLSQPPEHSLCFRCRFVEETIDDPMERQALLDYLDRDLGTDD